MGFTISHDAILAAQQNDAALDALLTALWPEAYRVAFGILHDRGLAEDAAQDACASIAGALPQLRSAGAFYTWMYRIIVRNATLTAKRRARTAKLEADVEPRTPTCEEERLDLLDAIAALPIPQRAAVVLRYYVGLSSREIAAVQGAPAATIRFHLMLARRALREALAEIDTENVTAREAYNNVR